MYSPPFYSRFDVVPALPPSIGNLKNLRKCMLAGNKLSNLPTEMSRCTELELLRIAANRLTALPDWIFELPRLAWFAYAGNPLESTAAESNLHLLAPRSDLVLIPYRDLELGECIGEGASGYVHKASWTQQAPHASEGAAVPVAVAVKLFKGETTSDGLPIHEMEVAIAHYCKCSVA